MSGILDKPALGPNRIVLRPYQEEAVSAVRNEFAKGKKSTLLILPTGCVAADTIIKFGDTRATYSAPIGKIYQAIQSLEYQGEILVRSYCDNSIRAHYIEGVVYSGKKETYTLVLANGRSIRATPDHEVMTNCGWVQIQDIDTDHLVVCESNLCQGLPEYSKVLGVVWYGLEDTYDIVCKDPHRNFVGNGIVVHNCGKTVVFGSITRRTIEKGGRVLILAHRDELIQQAVNKLDQLGVEVGVEQAASRARALFEPDAVVATTQTMQGKRLEGWPRDYFNLVIRDEAHLSTCPSDKRIYSHFNTAKLLGTTATPDRTDETSLGEVYQSIAYEMTLWEAMTAPPPGPYLCRLKFVQCNVDIDLRDIRTTGGDYNLADLEDRIGPKIETLANAIKQEITDRLTIVFCPDVKSSQAMATALASLGLRADWISGGDPDRKSKVERFRNGDIQVLANCAILGEGFDLPNLGAVALCRPTKSRLLYAQQVGRATRLYPGKEHALIIDFNFLTSDHDLVKAVELFDTTHTDTEVLDIAEKMLKEKPGQDLVDVIERAEKKHKEEQILRIKARERKVTYRKVSYDPVAVFETMGLAWRGGKDAVIHKATQRQVDFLKNSFGVENADGISKTRANTMIDYLSARRNENLATMKQVSYAIANGVDPPVARKMTKAEASEYLSKLWGKKK